MYMFRRCGLLQCLALHCPATYGIDAGRRIVAVVLLCFERSKQIAACQLVCTLHRHAPAHMARGLLTPGVKALVALQVHMTVFPASILQLLTSNALQALLHLPGNICLRWLAGCWLQVAASHYSVRHAECVAHKLMQKTCCTRIHHVDSV